MQPGPFVDESYQDSFPNRRTFIRDLADPEDHCLGELPGQICTSATEVNPNNEFIMNHQGDAGDHSSAFAGMYESDANYRWRKVRGNLDLFVMERNERHLTSLQWKWQKMSKSRRRTPMYENQGSYDPYSKGKARYPHPAYPPCDPNYPNYGYAPEYGSPTHYPPFYAHQHHPDFQYSPPPIHEGKMATPYAEPWMRKEMPTRAHHCGTKHACEEEMRLEEQRQRNEEIKNRLLNEQREMEYEIHNLKKLLNANRLHHEDSNCEKPDFNDKLEALEQQIADLDSKLTETSHRLKQNELETQNVSSKVSCSPGEGPTQRVPGHPLFIISDPHSGAAAAVTHGAYEESSQGSSSHEVSSYVNQSYRRDSIDKKLKEQENFKAELELQMANMKAELEKQLEEQKSKGEATSANVIDARVTNLEKQIEEMNKKIQSAEDIICNTELLRKKELENQARHPDAPSKHPKDHHDRHPHPKDDVKRLIKQLSLSPKVTPAPERKTGFEGNRTKLHQTASLETETSIQKNDTENDGKQMQDDDSESDDDVIILDDEPLDITIATSIPAVERHVAKENLGTPNVDLGKGKQAESANVISSLADKDKNNVKYKDSDNTNLIAKNSSSTSNEIRTSLERSSTKTKSESKKDEFFVELPVQDCDPSTGLETSPKMTEESKIVQGEQAPTNNSKNAPTEIEYKGMKNHLEKSPSFSTSLTNQTIMDTDSLQIEKSGKKPHTQQSQIKEDSFNVDTQTAPLLQRQKSDSDDFDNNKSDVDKCSQLKGRNSTDMSDKVKGSLQTLCSIEDMSDKVKGSLQTLRSIEEENDTNDAAKLDNLAQVNTMQSKQESKGESSLDQENDKLKGVTAKKSKPTQKTEILATPVSSCYTPLPKNLESSAKSISKESEFLTSKENLNVEEKATATLQTKQYLPLEKNRGKTYGSSLVKPTTKHGVQTNPSAARAPSRNAFTTSSTLAPSVRSRNFRRGSIADTGGHLSLLEKYRLQSELKKNEESDTSSKPEVIMVVMVEVVVRSQW